MDLELLIGLAALVVGILGLILPYHLTAREKRKKALAWDPGRPVQIANILPNRLGHRFVVTYEKEGSPPVSVREAYVWYVRIGNLGKDTIREEDLVTADPLRIEIREARVLDLAIHEVSRDAIGFKISDLSYEGEDSVTAKLSFLFLDYLDGAVIRIITAQRYVRMAFRGSVKGMPEGKRLVSELNKHEKHSCLFALAFVVVVVGTTFATSYFGLRFAGSLPSWLKPWFLFIPPTLAFLLVQWVSRRMSRSAWIWPASLAIPGWFSELDRREEKIRAVEDDF